MRILVCGGHGFLGGCLVTRLRKDGENVTVPNGDLRDYNYTLWMIKRSDIVYHLAAIVGGEKYLHGSDYAELSTMQANIVIDANVFRACLEAKVKRIIYTSSCAVYPMRRQQFLGTIFSEEDSKIVEPDGGYGWSKVIGENQLSFMQNVGIIRPFNIYGIGEPLDEHSHVVSDLIRKAIAYPAKKFEVFGGQQTRDFVYVDDCVDALISLEKKVGSSPIILNIGSGRATSIKELAEKIIEISGKDITPEYIEIPIRQYSRTADISKAKEVLSWEPRISLDEGLRRTYEWIKHNCLDLHEE